ncbi:MAG TPA: glycosyltransferase family 2 protein [Nitrospiraceae bacterium]|nr:glycosyltransferase family 2 protein [Nitrospiraceae bacterium]
MTTIAAVVITKNEEVNIGSCLVSLRWVHDLIVVDACSTDRTVEVVREYTPRVFIRSWPGFGPQKNYGLDQATADWVLVVDADERVTDELRHEIQAVLATSTDVVGYEIPRRNFFYGRWIKGGGLYPDYQLRLFRRSAGRYDDVLLHERLQLRGRIGRLRSPLDHYSMPSIGAHIQKMARYTTLGAQEKLKTRSCVTPLDLAGNHLVTIFKTYATRGGYRDGIHGAVVALFAGMHTFVKYAKAWEMVEQRGKKIGTG